MGTVRAIFVAILAFSVAMLPVAGAMARVNSHDLVVTASQADCCAKSMPCEKNTDGCGSAADCALKCLNFSAVASAPIDIALAASPLGKSALAIQGVLSPSENPPLPPPRV